MPKTTAVTNIEYETKRKFYYYSDKFIDAFKVSEYYTDKNGKRRKRDNGAVPAPLLRLFKILDNRWVFLDYFTTKTLSFHHKPDAKGNVKFTAWWERLRNTKLGVDKTDEKLLRDYSHEMDKRMVMVRAINDIASAAVYDDNIDTGFVEDVSDLLANLNDNGAYHISLSVAAKSHDYVTGADMLELVADFDHHGLLGFYTSTKARKDKVLKNRKKQARDKGRVKGAENAKPDSND